jgi:hypothetical protein
MPDGAGFMYRHIDAVGATNYEGWYDDTLAPPATVQAAIDAWLVRLRATFPGKVLIVSEFGAEANRLNASGTPRSESFQTSLFATVTGEAFRLRGRNRGGTHSRCGSRPRIRRVPNINSCRTNQKGLFTYDGSPVRVEAVRRAFS